MASPRRSISFIGDTSFGARKTFIAITLAWTIFMPVMGNHDELCTLDPLSGSAGCFRRPPSSLSAQKLFRPSWFPRHEHARANALWAVGSPIGAALAFPLVVFLDVNYGWESTFFVLGAITLVIVLPLLLLYVHNEPQRRSRRLPRKELDYIRAVDETAAESAPEDATAKANFMADVSFWMVTLCFVCYLGLIWGFNSWLPSYFKVARHLDVRAMGAFSSASFAMMFLGEILGSAFSASIGPARDRMFCGADCACRPAGDCADGE
ncbi:D-galactonate transporter [Castellaniella defragrans]